MTTREELILEITAKADAARREVSELERQLEDLQDTEVEVTADTDAAAGDLEDIAETTEDLAGSEVEVEVTADAEKATGTVDDLLEKVDKLDSEEAIVELKLAGDEIKQDLADIIADVDKLDSQDAQVEVKMAEGDKLIGDLEQIDAKVAEVDAARAEVTVTADTSQAVGGVDKITDSARGANSALANMVGNAGQDLGALAGVAGSAGVALGQLAEYASDAKLSGEGLGSVLRNMSGSVLPIAGIGAAVGLISSAMQESKERAAEAAAEMGRFTDGIIDAVGAAERLDSALEEAVDIGAAEPLAVLAQQFQAAFDTEKLNAYNQVLSDLNMTNAEYVTGLVEAGGTFRQYVEAQLLAADATEHQAEVIAKVIDEQDDYGSMQDRLFGANREWLDQNRELVDGLEALDDVVGASSTEELATNALNASRAIEGQAAAVDEAREATESESEALLYYIQLAQDRVAADARMEAGIKAAGAIAEAHAEALSEAATGAEEVTEAVGNTATSMEELARAQDLASAGTGAFAGSWEKIAEAVGRYIATGEEVVGVEAEIAAMMTYYGLSRDDVLEKGLELWEENTQATLDHIAAIARVNEAVREFRIELETAASRADGITDAFDRINAASELTAAQEVNEFVDSLEGLGDALDEIDLTEVDILPPPDDWQAWRDMPDEAVAVVDALAGFRTQVQSELGQAFETGGDAGARHWAEQTKQAVLDMLAESGTAIYDASGQYTQAAADVLHSVGLLDTDVTTTINLAHEEQVLNALDTVIAGIEDIPPQTAFDIQMAINDNDPAKAVDLINGYLLSIGQDPVMIDVDANPDPAADTISDVEDGSYETTVDVEGDPDPALRKISDVETGKYATTINADADTTAAANKLLDETSRYRTATIYALADFTAAKTVLDMLDDPRTAYITAVALTSAAEDELNHTARNRTSYVTQNVRTVHSSSGGGSTPVAASTAGPGVAPAAAAPVYAPHITINASVIGDRYDVQRTVTRALRGHARIAGARLVGAEAGTR